MTKEYIFTLEVDDEEVIWKCIVGENDCVTYEGDVECERFTLTTSERKPHVLQLDTKAKVYDDVLPLQVDDRFHRFHGFLPGLTGSVLVNDHIRFDAGAQYGRNDVLR